MTMTSKRKLPVLVEQSIGRVEVLRVEASSRLEMVLRAEVGRAGLNITCTAGCASCCYHPISISILEAIPIYRMLVRHGKWTTGLRKKLNEASERQIGASYEIWLLSLIPCPLLTIDNRCSVYDERPLICRTYVSVGDSHYCHPHRLGPETKLLPRADVVDKFHADQTTLLQKNRLQLSIVPIGTALLLAERVCSGDIELSAVDGEIVKEYAKHG